MDIVLLTTVISSLFLVIGAAEPLAARLSLPFSVILALLGILIGGGAVFLLRTELTDLFNPAARAVLDLPIRSDVFLYVFLPTLLFQATLEMHLRRMADDWVPIIVLAVLAVVVATFSIGYALSVFSGLPLAACLLIGSIVSTTDPSAVVSIFRSLSAPRRLARIIEGESLLNDAAAIALFGLFMGFVQLGGEDPSLLGTLGQFPVLFAGGFLTGWIAARACLWLMAHFARHELAAISVSAALPYLAYIGAEQLIGASGVIAVVVAGLTLNLSGPGRLHPQVWSNFRRAWGLLAHWAGALIFILAALLIPRMLQGVRITDLLLIGVIVLAAFAARGVILFGLLPLLSRFGLSPVIDRPYRLAILWGGLRGAVTLALALAVTESTRVPTDVKHAVGILATGYTLFTLMVQGTSLRAMIGRLGLDKLAPIDEAMSRQVVAVALQTVREDMARTTDDYQLSRDIVRSEAKQFGNRLEEAVSRAEDSTDILDRDRITLGLIALGGFERETILDRVADHTISTRMAEQILSVADRLIEGVRSSGAKGGRSAYQREARRAIAYGRPFRIALLLHSRLGWSRLLAELTADRFEQLLSQRLILQDLNVFIDGRIRRIHGRRVAELLSEMLARRLEGVERALEGLRLQYPGYAEELERRLIRRTALRLEEREFETMRRDGLIGAEVYTALMQDLSERQSELQVRPHLDIAVQRIELIRQFPLFADLEGKTLRRLARTLQTRYVDAGEVIFEKDNPAQGVHFIATGAVEMQLAGNPRRLGRGEMFGQMAVLMRRSYRMEVRSIAPTTLLFLDEERFRALLGKSRKLREAVRLSAEQRGYDPDKILADVA